MNMHPFKVLWGSKLLTSLYLWTVFIEHKQSAQVGHSSSVPVKIVSIVLVTSECYPGAHMLHVTAHPP